MMLRFQTNIDFFYFYEEVACKGGKKGYQDLAEHSTGTSNNELIKPNRKMKNWAVGLGA